ncbi:MAG: hypothetical protein QMD13_09355 [Candidatus Bathyarchaeia archaeon]|nr:hypothetical protein [Candidatus Bathyarchaeia archaeon]
MTVRVPKGVVKLPFTLTEYSTGVSLADGVANSEAEVVTFQIPRNMSVAFPSGSRFAFYARDTANAELFLGTVRVKLADANKTTKFTVAEFPIGAVGCGASGGKAAGLPQFADREKRALIAAGFSRNSDEFLIITYEDKEGKVLDDDEIALILEGVQFIQI